MKKLCFLVVLLAFTSSAHAGRSISFNLGKHRIHVESAGHCRSLKCASVSISKRHNWRHKRDRQEEERDVTVPARPAPPVPQTVSPPAPPSLAPPPKSIVTTPPAPVYTAAASRSLAVDPPPRAAPQAEGATIPAPPAPSVAEPVEAVPPSSPVERVLLRAEEQAPSDSPIGDWRTEGKGTVRIGKCGDALCGFALDSSNERGEAILINMKPKNEKQWTGGVYSQTSGETYYGTMSMKGINTLHVEACALGRFYCSGNNWSRVERRADDVVTSRAMSARIRT